MSTIASTAPGNWNTGATWVGGVVPGVADIATVNHALVLDANASVGGIDPASTGTVLANSSNVRLIIGSGGRPVIIGKGLVL